MAPAERFRFVLLALLAVLGWSGIAVVAVALAATSPSRLGFDLRLVLDAGSRATAGQPLYSGAVIAHPETFDASDLFYSYPPVVAQAAAAAAWLPLTVATGLFALVATAAATLVGSRLAAVSPSVPTQRHVVLALLAALPFVFPFSIAILFGNVDALYAAGFGLVLLAVLRPSRPTTIAGGVAFGLLSVAKVHPALLGLWLAVRGFRERRAGEVPWAWRTLGVAMLAAVAAVGASLAVFGTAPWMQYLDFVRAISAIRVVIPTNVEPAAQLGLLLGLSESVVRLLHLGVVGVAIGLAALAAWRVQDSVASLAVAATASLVVLPITWFHYPAALIPFAVVAVARSPRTLPIALAALVASLVSIALPVTVWVAVALVLVAVWPAPLGARLGFPAPEARTAG